MVDGLGQVVLRAQLDPTAPRVARLLDLVERGYEVEGLDASQDMLDGCRVKAAERGLQVTLHLGEMQSFSLARRYRSIFLAGASFSLLTTALAKSSTSRSPAGLTTSWV